MQLNKKEWHSECNLPSKLSFTKIFFFFFLVHCGGRTAQYFVQVRMRLTQKTSIISIFISVDSTKEIATGVKGRNSELLSSSDS